VWYAPSNLAAFGRHHSGRGETALPEIRIIALAECGTYAMLAARIVGSGEGESTIAEPLASASGPSMLVLGDGGFGGSYELFGGNRSVNPHALVRDGTGHSVPHRVCWWSWGPRPKTIVSAGGL